MFSFFLPHIDKARDGLCCKQEVDIFECSCALSFTFDLTIDCTAFQVKYVLQAFRVFELERVFHKHEMYLGCRARLYREHSKYFA